jgi:hypothetical protein
MVHCQQNYHISNVFVDGGKSGWVKLNKTIKHFNNAVLVGYDLIN